VAAESSLIVPLGDASAGLSLVGGKGASLARLAAAGLPVPPGFHITTAAYRRFVAEHGLQEPILAAVAAAATLDQAATLEEASGRIRRLFAEHAIPEDIAEPIRRAYAALADGDVPVAVRSSATAEDLPEASFAGQQETYLNVCGAEAVLEAVRRCWASLWTARAIGYRARHNIAPQDVSLAVVVQVLVPADAAGCVEGMVRRIDHIEDGGQIQPGEILVTSVTNIGWTPLFPRLAAIVTDVGAPLSHAAIVAREMGIPAVVGCGNATMLLKTGDRVRVDGGQGVVEVLTSTL